MIPADSTFEIVLSDAATTNQLGWYACWSWVGPDQVYTMSDYGLTNDVTPVTVISSDAESGSLYLISAVIYNQDTAVATVILQTRSDLLGVMEVQQITIPAGDSVHFERGVGWYGLDSLGKRK